MAANNQGIAHLRLSPYGKFPLIACGNGRAHIAVRLDAGFRDEPRKCARCAAALAKMDALEARRAASRVTSSPTSAADAQVVTRPFDVELTADQQARFGGWVGASELSPWQASVAKLAMLLNESKRGLIDYNAAQHFAMELMTRTAGTQA